MELSFLAKLRARSVSGAIKFVSAISFLTVCNSLVYPQDPNKIAPIVQEYLYSEFDNLGTRNTLKVNYLGGSSPWVGDKDDINHKAADAAIQVRTSSISYMSESSDTDHPPL